MINVQKPNGEIYATVDVEGHILKLSFPSFPKGEFIRMDKKIIPFLIDALQELREK